ncbi:hypothetical protein [Sulfurovum sp.]|uniref:M30 family zinc metallopeptidase n=1 Tax=Sulfurovum sp. TaxID=1969726 RepID=UPI003563C944
MRLNSLLTLSFVGTMIFVGCGGGGGGTPITNPIVSDVNVTITDDYDYQIESLGSANTINASVSIEGASKSLYLVLSNNDVDETGSATIRHNAKVIPVVQAKTLLSIDFSEKPIILHAPQYVQDFSSQLGTLVSKIETSQPQVKIMAVPERMEDIANESTMTFYRSSDNTDPTEATARKVVSDGVKTLNIWVSNDSFGSGCPKEPTCVTEDMVNELANAFLLAGSDNDIYDWVTNIYGEEWSSRAEAKYNYLIPANDEITILLTDIDDDGLPSSEEGRVVGFFWGKDNFDKTVFSGSNERVMFYIDSVMFANGGSPWSIDDTWPKEIVSTLAHEFQHMIHYYQKNVLRYSNITDNTDTWINEMLSECTEDLVATKIQHIGPRAVDYLDGSAGDPYNIYGRYPTFNRYNALSLTSWNGLLADYSKVSAFGAYLVRNYGGAVVLNNIMYNSSIDEQAVVDAVPGKTFANLLSEWGIAVMLSDHDNLANTPFYNTGDFTYSTYKDIIYDMGSINFFNYLPLPTIDTQEGTITVEPQGNYYYKIGENLTGDINISLELNGQTEATLIAK